MNRKIAMAVFALSVGALALISSCATTSVPQKSDVIIEDKGTAGKATMPLWVPAAMLGDTLSLERMPDFAGMIVVTTVSEAQSLERANELAGKVRPQTEMGYFLSVRVGKALKNAKVPAQDFKSYSAYSERFLSGVEEAIYEDFSKKADWWVKVRTYAANEKQDKELYRVIQVWAVEKKLLKKKFDLILATVNSQAAPVPESVRAKNLIEDTLAKDFFRE
jgi:hypothetical protein